MAEISVRIASLEDYGELFALLRQWHEEEGVAPFDEGAAHAMLYQLLNGMGVVGVIGEPGSIEASISLLPGRLWYSSEYTLESLWNYVLPQFRKSANAKALAQFAKRQAARLGLPILLEVVSNGGNAPKLALYERVFGSPAGAAFHYRAQDEKLQPFAGAPFRTASSGDLDDILSICRQAHEESGSFQAAEDMAIPVIEDELEGNGVIGLIGEPGHVEGSISIHTARMWYSAEPLLEERWLYVRPAYRKSNNAKNLITFAKRQAQRLRIPLRIGVISRKETEQKVNLYRRLLGQPSAIYFLHKSE